MVLKIEHSGKWFRNSLKVLKYDAGQGLRTEHVKKLRIITKSQEGNKQPIYNKSEES
jgi:hypothetical protein